MSLLIKPPWNYHSKYAKLLYIQADYSRECTLVAIWVLMIIGNEMRGVRC